MNETNNGGFNGVVTIGLGRTKIKIRNGYDKLSLKCNMHTQPFNQLFWLRKEKELLYRSSNGELFRLNFEKIEL